MQAVAGGAFRTAIGTVIRGTRQVMYDRIGGPTGPSLDGRPGSAWLPMILMYHSVADVARNQPPVRDAQPVR